MDPHSNCFENPKTYEQRAQMKYLPCRKVQTEYVIHNSESFNPRQFNENQYQKYILNYVLCFVVIMVKSIDRIINPFNTIPFRQLIGLIFELSNACVKVVAIQGLIYDSAIPIHSFQATLVTVKDIIPESEHIIRLIPPTVSFNSSTIKRTL